MLFKPTLAGIVAGYEKLSAQLESFIDATDAEVAGVESQITALESVVEFKLGEISRARRIKERVTEFVS